MQGNNSIKPEIPTLKLGTIHSEIFRAEQRVEFDRAMDRLGIGPFARELRWEKWINTPLPPLPSRS